MKILELTHSLVLPGPMKHAIRRSSHKNVSAELSAVVGLKENTSSGKPALLFSQPTHRGPGWCQTSGKEGGREGWRLLKPKLGQ